MSVQSVDRALSLLEAIAARPGGLTDVATRTGFPLSTTARLLATLEERGAVVRGENGMFVVGPFLRGLSGVATSTASIQDAAQPELASLADELREAACLSIPIGSQTLTLLQIDVPKPVQAQDWTGHRWDITGGGSGAVMMSTWPADRVDELLAPLSGRRRRLVRDEIATARRTGVSWSHGTYVDGLSSVAAPVVDRSGRAIAALLGYGPSYRFPPKGRVRAVERLVAGAAARVSERVAG